MNTPPNNRRVMNVPLNRPANVITRQELEEMTARDLQCAETWFTGPASFTAQAARDRRALLGAVCIYAAVCDDLRANLKALIEETRT